VVRGSGPVAGCQDPAMPVPVPVQPQPHLGFARYYRIPALRRSGKTPLKKPQFSAGSVSHLAGSMDPGMSCKKFLTGWGACVE